MLKRLSDGGGAMRRKIKLIFRKLSERPTGLLHTPGVQCSSFDPPMTEAEYARALRKALDDAKETLDAIV